MKINYILVGSLAFLNFLARAQSERDTALQQKKTEIEWVYGQYMQDGNHSAVTGGTGTEKLSVYGPSLKVRTIAGKNSLTLQLGSDIITSASTDKIDFVVSSASRRDARNYIQWDYARKFPSKGISVHAGNGFSMESDFLSISGNLGVSKQNENKQREFSADLQYFNDDLRWGRLNPDYRKPVRLVYPQELRYREWFTQYRRHSVSLYMGITQIINKRNTAGIFPEVTLQKGLLSTPFHRVCFAGDSLVVEKLPGKRLRAALAFRWNTFAGGAAIIKNQLNAYADNFGIRALTLENETVLKLSPTYALMPNLRFYMQNGSPYFAGYKIHTADESFYSSDYDLSNLNTFTAGLGVRISPQHYLSKKHVFNAMIIRYNYMIRSDELKAHYFSVVFQTSRYKTSLVRN